jgi:hypothetical protein
MTAAETNARAIMAQIRTDNPTLAQINHAFRMIRDRDLVHVDEIAAWVMSQDAEYRADLLAELQAMEAEAQHDQRQREGYPSSAPYLAECIRKAGRGHLLGDQ